MLEGWRQLPGNNFYRFRFLNYSDCTAERVQQLFANNLSTRYWIVCGSTASGQDLDEFKTLCPALRSLNQDMKILQITLVARLPPPAANPNKLAHPPLSTPLSYHVAKRFMMLCPARIGTWPDPPMTAHNAQQAFIRLRTNVHAGKLQLSPETSAQSPAPVPTIGKATAPAWRRIGGAIQQLIARKKAAELEP